MMTIHETVQKMTNVQTYTQSIKEILKELDPDFFELEKNYLAALDILAQTGSDLSCITEYLAAREQALGYELLYLCWKGFRFALDCYNNPVTKLLLRESFETIHQEYRMQNISAIRDGYRSIDALEVKLRGASESFFAISDYYSYLQTMGYKIAHYYGFRIADLFLEFVIPGYCSDPQIGSCYERMLKEYMQIPVEKLV